MSEQDAYGDGYTHEAMHATWMLMCTFESFVMEARCAKEFPDVAAAAEKAHQALFDLYQLIGNKWEPAPQTKERQE